MKAQAMSGNNRDIKYKAAFDLMFDNKYISNLKMH